MWGLFLGGGPYTMIPYHESYGCDLVKKFQKFQEP